MKLGFVSASVALLGLWPTATGAAGVGRTEARLAATPPAAAWAWCKVSGTVAPQSGDGVTKQGDTLWFVRKNAEGAAEFDFGLLATRGWKPADGAIHFVAGNVTVAGFVVPASVSWDIAFIGDAGGTSLTSRPAAASDIHERSPFRVTVTGTARRRFVGLGFVGADDARAPFDGGAILQRGGSLDVIGCTFTNCRTAPVGELGGAICAMGLADNSLVSNSTFTSCTSATHNGAGGAIYASAASASVVLSVVDSTFASNRADMDGGAICTRLIDTVGAYPAKLRLAGDVFADNRADMNGGAILLAADAEVTNTVFKGNVAGVEGGAVCLATASVGVVPMTLSLRADTVFRGNAVSGADVWTCGGAVAVMCEGATLTAEGRHVIFDRNVVTSDVMSFGGAVFLAPGTTARIATAGFLANSAEDGGGAVFATGADAVISTCIFSNDTVSAAYAGFGGAVATEESTLCLSNCTVRGANGNAVDLWETDAELVNCVIADNGKAADVSATTDVGGAAKLKLRVVSYGTLEASDTVDVTMDGCRSGTTAAVYRGKSLLLDSQTKYLPEAAEGIVQSARDYVGVAYGSRPAGSSMGAYECPTPTSDPVIEIDGTEWFHNRGNGMYYPRITVRFVDGDASRITGLTLKSESGEHELPQQCVDEMLTATNGQLFVFGVNPDKFPNSYDRTNHDGYIIWDDPAEKERVMLFGEYQSVRPLQLELVVTGTVHFSDVEPVTTMRRLRAVELPQTVDVPAAFGAFGVGDRLTGRAVAPSGSRVLLYGAASLAGSWSFVRELTTDREGRFETAVPAGFRFFKLKAEVSR